MDRIKIRNMDKSNIENFVKYNEKTFIIDKEDVRDVAFLDLGILSASIFLYDNKIMVGTIILFIDILIVLSLVHFLRKIEFNKKNINLYFGRYFLLLSGILNYLGYSFFQTQGKMLWVIIPLIILNVFVGWITIYAYKKKIYTNFFENPLKINRKLSSSVGGCVGTMAVAASSIFDGNIYIKLGIASICVGVFFMQGVLFVLKYYCYDLIENNKIEV